MIIFVFLLSTLSESLNFTVSGFSSGAFMAMQLHIAYSSSIQGAGVLAGGPYHCMSSFSAKTCTSFPSSLNTSTLINYAKLQEKQAKIDPLNNIKNSKVWVMGGSKDLMIDQKTVKKVEELYRVLEADVKTIYDIESPHGFVTDSYGVICSLYNWPYINNCGFDAAGSLLSHLYGNLHERVPFKESHVFRFGQAEFGGDSVGMDEFGFIFVPSACWQSECRVHLALHGCGMNYQYIGRAFTHFSGYNEWAESNSIIVVYPQAARHHRLNYGACWDAKGEWDSDYCTKKGKQVSVLYEIVQNVSRIVSGLILKEFIE